MINIQDELLALNIGTSNINNEYSDDEIQENQDINDSSEDDIPKFNEKKRKRKNKGKQSIKTYEVENIIDHKYENNKYLFLVKWKYYDENENTWIPYNNFNEKEIINKYLDQTHIQI